MTFEYDNQTFQDLEILKDYKQPSVFSLFNNTSTVGGREFLKELMKCPISDQIELEKRVKIIRFFMTRQIELAYNSRQLNYIEKYLNLNVNVLKRNPLDSLFNRLSEWIRPSNNYHLIKSGCLCLIEVLSELSNKIDFEDLPKELTAELKTIRELIEKLKKELRPQLKTSWDKVIQLDRIFRIKLSTKLQPLLKEIYFIDAYTSISKTATKKGFTLPLYDNSVNPILIATELKHPLLAKAISNDLHIDENENMVFLSGPNMAGKSTLLKSIGISIYLAHLGFPVPAKEFKTSLYSGIMTTINLSDNLSFGHSHFYSEVNRVKEAAQYLANGKQMFVIFDELFRGTNVKDAFEASTEIIKGFAKIESCTFLVSTHIVEIAEEIKELQNIIFKCFDSEHLDKPLSYNYKLKNGVSSQRLGMHIVEKEGIFELLNSIRKPS